MPESSTIRALFAFLLLATIGIVGTETAQAQCNNLSVDLISYDTLYVNYSKGLEAQYVGYNVFNNAVGDCDSLYAVSNIFDGGASNDVFHAPHESGIQLIGNIPPGTGRGLYYYLGIRDMNPSAVGTPVQQSLTFWDDLPPAWSGPGTKIQVAGADSTVFTLNTENSQEASADKIDSAKVITQGELAWGDTLLFAVWGYSTTIGADESVIASPTVELNFRADTLDLLNSALLIYQSLPPNDTLAQELNQLVFTIPSTETATKFNYEALYQVQIIQFPLGPAPSASAGTESIATASKTMATGPESRPEDVVPVFIVASGTQNKFLRPAAVPELPVELTEFAAKRDGNDVVLEWRTASETNNSHFEIEHSDNGEGFLQVSSMPGRGNSDYLMIYETRLKDIGPGYHRFRLKQVDFDGAFEYSSVVEVTGDLPGTHVLSDAYPNPFNPSTNFTLVVSRTQEVSVALFDVLGRQVKSIYQGTLDANVATTLRVDADLLPSGTYTYVVTGENFRESRNVVLMK